MRSSAVTILLRRTRGTEQATASLPRAGGNSGIPTYTAWSPCIPSTVRWVSPVGVRITTCGRAREAGKIRPRRVLCGDPPKFSPSTGWRMVPAQPARAFVAETWAIRDRHRQTLGGSAGSGSSCGIWAPDEERRPDGHGQSRGDRRIPPGTTGPGEQDPRIRPRITPVSEWAVVQAIREFSWRWPCLSRAASSPLSCGNYQVRAA